MTGYSPLVVGVTISNGFGGGVLPGVWGESQFDVSTFLHVKGNFPRSKTVVVAKAGLLSHCAMALTQCYTLYETETERTCLFTTYGESLAFLWLK